MKKKLIILGLTILGLGLIYTFTILLKSPLTYSRYESLVNDTQDKKDILTAQLEQTELRLCTYTKKWDYLKNTGKPDWEYFETIEECAPEEKAQSGGHNTEQEEVPVTNTQAFSEEYHKPEDLFFAFLKKDNPKITQTLKQHFSNNGYLATDIGTNHKKIDVYAPSFMFMDGEGNKKDEEREYIVKVTENYGTMGWTIELNWEEHNVKNAFWIGHMNQVYVADGQKVKTGDKIGLSGGCPGELKFNEKSTGCHIHFEYRIDGQESTYPGYMYTNHGDELKLFKQNKGVEAASGSTEKVPPQEPIAGLYTKYKDVHEDMPSVLEAIHQRESGKCTENCKTSYAGAKGPFQFMDRTWKYYGCDGDGDGVKDVQNVYDGACGAQNYLITLFKNEQSYNQSLDDKWIWWKAFYRYNAGYSKHATHEDGIPAGVAYADDVLRMADQIEY